MIEWNGKKLAEEISNHISDSVVSSDDNSVYISREKIYEVLKFLKETSGFSFDYIDHFEVVYQLKSLITLSKATIKVKLGFGREDQPEIDSAYNLWKGADFQEREVFDLMGIHFVNHPNLKRILLWDGFPGHPLRKDFVTNSQSIVDDGEDK